MSIDANNGFARPFLPQSGANADDFNLKLAHDRYEVFVNQDFVGHKVLVSQGEDIRDVESFLKSNGYSGFQTELEGDHFSIEMKDAEQAQRAKSQLEIYLQTR